MSVPAEKPPVKELGNEMSRPVMAAGSAIVIFLGGGAIVYHALESWSWIGSLYFCVSSLTTVGYGDLLPTRDATRLFTIFYLLSGSGVVVASVGVIGSRYLERRDRMIAQRRARQKSHSDSEAQL
ncbi:MAG: potassium channel family protein [Actinobacteria bacterium]|nr:potassium channel family protein [Actinomycetota bacterium]MCL5882478.1 potassium channel family protein [Actinomycetota bacterium]